MNDKEGRKWLLQKLYDNGFKYIFHSGGIGGYIATKRQPKFENDRTYIEGNFERIDVLSGLIQILMSRIISILASIWVFLIGVRWL